MKNFQILLLIFLPVFVFSQVSNTPAQEEFEQSFVSSKTGGLILYSGENHSFTIEMKAKEIKTSGQPNYFLVGNQIVQSAILPIPKKGDYQNLSTEKQKEILKDYVNYELEYFRSTLKQVYRNLSIEYLIINDRQFVYWHFDMPEQDNKHVKKQIYLSTICFDHILDLNAPVFDDFFKAKDLLTQMAGSIRTYNTHLDIATVAAAEKNSPGNGSTLPAGGQDKGNLQRH